MRKIGWRHYRILLAIQDSGSLTAAGKAVGLTQSAASHQVKEAERRLGAELVLRHGRSLRLTEAGKALAAAAEACAPLLLEAETKAREISNIGWQRLRIAFGPQDGLNWVPDVARHLRTAGDSLQLQLDLIATEQNQAANQLRLAKADLALEIGHSAFPELRRHQVCEDELVCICPADVPSRKGSSDTPVTVQEIAGETYFAHSLVPQTGFELDAFFQPADHRPAHVAQVQSVPAIIALVAAGQGVSIQPRSAVADAVKNGSVIARSLAPKAIWQPWFLYARPDALAQYGERLMTGVAETIAPHLVPA